MRFDSDAVAVRVLTIVSASDAEAVAMVYVTVIPSVRRRRLVAAIVTVTDDSATFAIAAIAATKTSLFDSASATVRPENVMSPVTTDAVLEEPSVTGNGCGEDVWVLGLEEDCVDDTGCVEDASVLGLEEDCVDDAGCVEDSSVLELDEI